MCVTLPLIYLAVFMRINMQEGMAERATNSSSCIKDR